MPGSEERTVTESGFRISLNRPASFRFCEAGPYRNLSALHLKEMDVGWWDASGGRLLLVELKSAEVWRTFDANRNAAHEHLVESLRDKATDALMMLAAAWLGTGWGRDLREHLPREASRYPGDGKIKLVFLLDTPPSRKPLLQAVKDHLNRKAAGRCRLFGIQRITVVDFERARKMGLPVERVA